MSEMVRRSFASLIIYLLKGQEESEKPRCGFTPYGDVIITVPPLPACSSTFFKYQMAYQVVLGDAVVGAFGVSEQRRHGLIIPIIIIRGEAENSNNILV